MANKKVLNDKKNVVETIKNKVNDSSITVLTGYRGLSVSELTQLRRQLRPEGAELKVYKNTLARFALDALNISYPEGQLVGPIAMVNVDGDASQVAKVLVKFAKDSENLEIRGGILDGKAIDSEMIKSLSKLPSREELIAKVVGGIKAPISGLVATLSSPTRGLVLVMNSIKAQKESTN